jgi:hypothetical protein
MNNCDRCQTITTLFSCVDCEANICDICWNEVHFNTKTRQHNKLPHEEIQIITESPTIQVCTKKGHEDIPCDLVCLTRVCYENSICNVCSLTNHKDHKVMNLVSFINKLKFLADAEREKILSRIQALILSYMDRMIFLENIINMEHNLKNTNIGRLVKIATNLETGFNFSYCVIPEEKIDLNCIDFLDYQDIRVYSKDNELSRNSIAFNQILVIIFEGTGEFKDQISFFIIDSWVKNNSFTFKYYPSGINCYLDNKTIRVEEDTSIKCNQLLLSLNEIIYHDVINNSYSFNGTKLSDNGGSILVCPMVYNW